MSGAYCYLASAGKSNGKGPKGAVAKTIECRQGGLICGARVEAGTDEDVLRKAVVHAREKHGVELDRSQTLVRYLQSLIRET